MNELVYILEAAKEHYVLENMWWESFQESNDNTDYVLFSNERGCVKGLLQAYEIISGRRVFGFTIDEELEAIA